MSKKSNRGGEENVPMITHRKFQIPESNERVRNAAYKGKNNFKASPTNAIS